MLDGQGDENIGAEVGIAVGVQIRGQLDLLRHIGLDQCLPKGVTVVLGLAHEGLGDGRNHGVDLDLAVGVDIGQLGAVEPQNIHPLSVTLDVTRNCAGDHGFTVLQGGGLTADGRQIIDQIMAAVMVGKNGVGQRLTLHIQPHHDILFLIQKKLTEISHSDHLISFFPAAPAVPPADR